MVDKPDIAPPNAAPPPGTSRGWGDLGLWTGRGVVNRVSSSTVDAGEHEEDA